MNNLIEKSQNHAIWTFWKVINSFIVFCTITFRGLHFFCYVAAIFKHIEKKKYAELRITQFVSTSKIIYFLE